MFDCGDYISGNRLMYAAEEIERTFTVKIDHAASFLQTVAPRLIRPFNIVTHWGENGVKKAVDEAFGDRVIYRNPWENCWIVRV